MRFIFIAVDVYYTMSKLKIILKIKSKRSTENLNENCIHQKFNLYCRNLMSGTDLALNSYPN